MIKLIETLDNTFCKSSLQELKAYLNKHHDSKNFIIASDYCIGDKQKTNDTISFCIYHNISNFPIYQDVIQQILPNDIKHTKKINHLLKHLIDSGSIFIINFILPKGQIRLFKNLPKEHVLDGINKTIEMISLWIQNEPEKKPTYEKMKKSFILLQQEQKRKSFNINLFTNIILVATLAAYISHKIFKHSNAENIIWFSDRDNITSFCNGIIYEYYSIQHNGISCNDLEYKKDSVLSIGTSLETEECWYDQINRIPDYFAGAYADFDYIKNTITSEKYKEIVEFSNNNVVNIILEQEPTDYSTHIIKGKRLGINSK